MSEREEMSCDVVVVGAGPAGLAAAIRLKQLAPDLSVMVLEKGAEVGAHILSGAVIDPIGLDTLLPGWRDENSPVRTKVSEDRLSVLTATNAIPLPGLMMPRLMSNHGMYVVSLGDVCRWLAEKATALGVDVLPGFAAAAPLIGPTGALEGVITGDRGRLPDGGEGPDFEPGIALRAKYTLIGEGVRGSLAKELIVRYRLDAASSPQKYGIGIKELWRVRPENHQPGLVEHSFGWPLGGDTGGGGFIYHLDDNLVSIGLVVHLNYKNPYLSPFEEFQRYKTHPFVRGTFTGATRLAYGSRAISEGGYRAVPQLAFPGGVLIGDSAGFVNLPRIKGSHNAMLSGILAADHVAAAIAAGRSGDTLTAIDTAWRDGPIGRDLAAVQNVKPLWSRFGTLPTIGLSGIDLWTRQLFGRSPLSLRDDRPDHEMLEPAARHKPIRYPRPDGVLTFDRLSSVALSATSHREGEPPHLIVADLALQEQSEHDVYAGPSTRYCPAGVYEWLETATGPVYVINAQNCVHCKTCDIKDPNQNITFVPPEGGGGPNYPNM